MMNTITVTFDDKSSREIPANSSVCSVVPEPANAAGLPYLAALVNNDLVSCTYPLTVNCHLRMLAADDPHGRRVYDRSLCFLLAKAVRDLFPAAVFSVEHSFGPGLYCSFHPSIDDTQGITPEELARLETHLHELVALDLPIERRKISYTDAMRAMEQRGLTERINLLSFRNPPRVVVHWCDGFGDLAHGPLAPRTGVLRHFRLVHRPPGFVLQLPSAQDPTVVPGFEDQPHLFHILQEHKEWGRILGVNTVGRLNEIIAAGQVEDFIHTAEALHEKKVARIADAIAARRDQTRVVLIAGPSSSGKTTFAKRLSIHLLVNGLRPVTLSTDDYFVGEDRNPRDEHGKPDYEHVEAVDLALFNRDLLTLIAGGEIALPRFNFETKSREYRGESLRITGENIILIEGIHGLNPLLTSQVAAANKFKIYISALTQLSVDASNRISTTDNRLMRRMVRDHKFRGHTALATLRLWPAVRKGEERWIFPFQKEADATFNSALDYELAVLKPLVEPLLLTVKPSHAEYVEARRLSEFLLNFLGAPDRCVPRTSILREYIGGSHFRY